MRFFTFLLAGAACVTNAFAQVSIAFTSVPVAVVVGEQYTITWGGGDGVTPVTITLRRGDPQDLQTVSTLTSTGADGSFVWTPDSSLSTGEDYALQITQGQSDINYSGPFAVIGGTGSSSISFSGTSTLEPASMNSTMTSTTGGVSITSEVSMGTGVSMSRNTTFSSQTLASTSSDSSASTSSTSRTTSRSSTASRTGSDSAETSSPNGATHLASSAALVLGVVAAIISLH